jgi:hypothetical protein
MEPKFLPRIEIIGEMTIRHYDSALHILLRFDRRNELDICLLVEELDGEFN